MLYLQLCGILVNFEGMGVGKNIGRKRKRKKRICHELKYLIPLLSHFHTFGGTICIIKLLCFYVLPPSIAYIAELLV